MTSQSPPLLGGSLYNTITVNSMKEVSGRGNEGAHVVTHEIAARTASSSALTLLMSAVAPFSSMWSTWLRGPLSEVYSASECLRESVRPQPALWESTDVADDEVRLRLQGGQVERQ